MMKNLEEVVMQSNELILAYRGYSLTGKENFLQQYNKADSELSKLDGLFTGLREDHKSFSPQSAELMTATEQLRRFARKVVEQRTNKGMKAGLALIDSQEGESLRNDINVMIIALENQGRKRLRVLEVEQQRLVERSSIINYGLAGFSLMLILYVFKLLQQRFDRKRESMAKLQDTNEQLGEEVRQKNEQMLNMFERITDAFVALDKNWNFTYANSRALQMLQRTSEQLIGNNMWDVFPEGVGTQYYNAYSQAMREQKYMHVEDFYAPLDMWIETHIYPSPNGISIFFRDVSKRRRAETERQRVLDELRKSEARLRTIFDTTDSSYALVGPDLKLISFNYKAQEFVQNEFGTTLHVGDNVAEVLTTERFEMLQGMIREAHTGKQLSMEREYPQADGSSNWYMVGVYRIGTENANAEGYNILISVQDITEQKRVASRIVYERNLSESVINSLPGIFYLANTQGELVRWNKNFETVSGYTAEEMPGRRVATFVDPADRELLMSKKMQAINEGSSALTLNFLTKEGQTLPYYFTSWLTEYEGQPALLGIGMDVSDRVKAENELRESHEQLRQLSSHLQTVREEERTNIAREIHDELGQQLTGLKMDVTWLGKKIAGEGEFVREKIEGILSLIDDIIKSVRKISSDLRPGILDDLGLVAALEWQSSEFQKRSGMISEFKTKSRELNLDRKKATGVFRIYQEALTNVMRHAGATRVNASLEENDNVLLLRIHDNGKGFDPGSIESKKTLGLIGMKERAFMLGGELEIISGEGKGTSLTLKVPLDLEIEKRLS